MNTLIADFGKNKVFTWNPHTDARGEFTPEEFLCLPKTLEPDKHLIVENAHMGVPKSKRSRAQFFTKEQLEKFSRDCKDNDINTELFCEQQTGRARNAAGLEKDDENDMLAIFLHLKKYPHIALKKMPLHFDPSPVRQEGQDFKDDTTMFLNLTRGDGYEGYLEEDNKLSVFLLGHLNKISLQLTDDGKNVFRLTDKNRYKRDCKSGKAGDFKLNNSGICLPQIYSIASLFMDYDGNLRLRESTGELPGWNFVRKHVLRMSPYHWRGGVARSNLYYHGIRNYIAPRMTQTIYDSIDIDTVSIETLSERFDSPSKGEKKKKNRLHHYTQAEWVAMTKEKKGKILLQHIKKDMIGKKRGRKRDENYRIIEGSDFTQEQEQEFLKHRSTYCRAIKELFFIIKECVRSSGHQSVA